MQLQRATIDDDTPKQGQRYWNATFQRWETLYGNEEMLLGSEHRNQAIAKAQIANNGGLTNEQTRDLIVMIKEAHTWLCRTGRRHMLGSFDMVGLHEIEEVDTGAAALPSTQQPLVPSAATNESPALGQTENNGEAPEETDRTKTP